MIQISQNDLSLFKKISRRQTYKAGETIYLQGDISPKIYLIQKGRVRMFYIGENGKEITFQIIGESQLFGESAFLTQVSRPTTITAVVDVVLLSCTIAELFPLLAMSQQLSEVIFQLLSDNYNHLCNQVKRLSIYDSRQRVASYLLEQTAADGRGLGITDATLHYTHEELAACLNLHRVTVTNILKEFSQNGFVKLGRKRIQVTDAAGLQHILIQN